MSPQYAEGRLVSYVPYQARISCNSPEFNELDDQNKNTYKPYAGHCASSDLAPMSRDVGRGFVQRPALPLV
jgi:hypothetical protein